METDKDENGCSKKAFDGKKVANKRILEIRDEENQKKKEERGTIPIRAYKCAVCGKWHLTSLSREKWKTAKKARRKNFPSRKEKFYQEVQYWLDKLGLDRD